MTFRLQSVWLPRFAAFVLAAVAAASAVYWGLKWPAAQEIRDTAAPLSMQERPAPDPAALARVLGGGLVAPAEQTAPLAAATVNRLTLIGVVSTRRQAGTALISIDGKPARPYRVGAKVEDGLVLYSVGPRRASLAASANGPASVTIELPQLAKR